MKSSATFFKLRKDDFNIQAEKDKLEYHSYFRRLFAQASMASTIGCVLSVWGGEYIWAVITFISASVLYRFSRVANKSVTTHKYNIEMMSFCISYNSCACVELGEDPTIPHDPFRFEHL